MTQPIGTGSFNRGTKSNWKVNNHQFKPKLRSALTLLGLFSGVMFTSYGIVNYMDFWYLIIVGLLLSSISMIIQDIRELPPKVTMVPVEGEEDNFVDEDEDEDRPNLVKKYLLYLASTLGLGLHIGAWLSLVLSEGPNFWLLYILGIIVSLLSRYNLFKHKFTAIVEDYLMYINPYIGMFLMVSGMHLFSSHWELAVIMILSGVVWAPFMLRVRERYMFKVFMFEKWRKYLSLVSITFGISCFLFGLSVVAENYIIGALFIIEGIMLVVASAIISNNRMIVNYKDIL